MKYCLYYIIFYLYAEAHSYFPCWPMTDSLDGKFGSIFFVTFPQGMTSKIVRVESVFYNIIEVHYKLHKSNISGRMYLIAPHWAGVHIISSVHHRY